MRRPLICFAALIVLALPASAHAEAFLGDAIDGPPATISALGDLDLARDGTGALAYVRADAGVDHIFVAQFGGGVFAPAAQIDVGLPGVGAQPAVAASDGGRFAAVFVNDGIVYGVVKPAGQPVAAPVPFGPGTAPAIDMSINGTAYATY